MIGTDFIHLLRQEERKKNPLGDLQCSKERRKRNASPSIVIIYVSVLKEWEYEKYVDNYLEEYTHKFILIEHKLVLMNVYK